MSGQNRPFRLGFEQGQDDEDEVKNPREDGLVQRMLETRTILLAGQVDEKLAEKAIRMLLTTPGGHVDSGFAIHDMIRFIESPVITIGAGWVASIGVPILLAAEKDSRYSLPHTRFLLHQPSGGAGGQASDIRIAAEEILKLRVRINLLIATETGQDPKKVETDSDRNYWMTSDQALDYGLISRVITSAGELG
jgi:ATP-dependent Clp protease protease subunit